MYDLDDICYECTGYGGTVVAWMDFPEPYKED